jgi:hypothetical protein
VGPALQLHGPDLLDGLGCLADFAAVASSDWEGARRSGPPICRSAKRLVRQKVEHLPARDQTNRGVPVGKHDRDACVFV